MTLTEQLIYGWVAFILVLGFYPPLRLASMGRRRLADHVSRAATICLLPALFYLFPFIFATTPALAGRDTWLARVYDATPLALPILSVTLWVAASLVAAAMRLSEQSSTGDPTTVSRAQSL